MEVTTVDYMWAESGLTSFGFRKRGLGFGGLNLLYTISVRDLRLIRITNTPASVSEILGKAATGCIDNLIEGW